MGNSDSSTKVDPDTAEAPDPRSPTLGGGGDGLSAASADTSECSRYPPRSLLLNETTIRPCIFDLDNKEDDEEDADDEGGEPPAKRRVPDDRGDNSNTGVGGTAQQPGGVMLQQPAAAPGTSGPQQHPAAADAPSVTWDLPMPGDAEKYSQSQPPQPPTEPQPPPDPADSVISCRLERELKSVVDEIARTEKSTPYEMTEKQYYDYLLARADDPCEKILNHRGVPWDNPFSWFYAMKTKTAAEWRMKTKTAAEWNWQEPLRLLILYAAHRVHREKWARKREAENATDLIPEAVLHLW